MGIQITTGGNSAFPGGLPDREEQASLGKGNNLIVLFSDAETDSSDGMNILRAQAKLEALGPIWDNFLKKHPDLVTAAQVAVRAQALSGIVTSRVTTTLTDMFRKGIDAAEIDKLASFDKERRAPVDEACSIALDACYHKLIELGAREADLWT